MAMTAARDTTTRIKRTVEYVLLGALAVMLALVLGVQLIVIKTDPAPVPGAAATPAPIGSPTPVPQAPLQVVVEFRDLETDQPLARTTVGLRASWIPEELETSFDLSPREVAAVALRIHQPVWAETNGEGVAVWDVTRPGPYWVQIALEDGRVIDADDIAIGTHAEQRFTLFVNTEAR